MVQGTHCQPTLTVKVTAAERIHPQFDDVGSMSQERHRERERETSREREDGG